MDDAALGAVVKDETILHALHQNINYAWFPPASLGASCGCDWGWRERQHLPSKRQTSEICNGHQQAPDIAKEAADMILTDDNFHST